MSVDFDAIAQRGRCDVSSLRLAMPLLEQGYTPPFLARYRRDELGGVSEASLWELLSSLQADQETQSLRESLVESWEETTLRDPAIGSALRSSRSLRMLNRLGRRLKRETGDSVSSSAKLAVRVMNPEQGDPAGAQEIASIIEGLEGPEEAVQGLDAALAERIAGDPRVISAAVRWLSRNAKIHISKVHDPHLAGDDEPSGSKKKKKKASAKTESKIESDENAVDASSSTEMVQSDDTKEVEAGQAADAVDTSAASQDAAEVSAAIDSAASNSTEAVEPTSSDASPDATTEVVVQESVAENQTGSDDSNTEDGSGANVADSAPSEEASESESTDSSSAVSVSPAVADAVPTESEEPSGSNEASGSNESSGAKASAEKKQKKVSPRQRRRRWLVSVLKPLSGKRFAGDKLSSFQIVMLGRALRSQVVVCSFEYDATRLVAELQRVAGSMNQHFESKLKEIVLQFEGIIREAGETAWWDDLHEKASSKLVAITANHLERQVNRGSLDGRVVLAIDAVGPRTAATSIVCADGRILHNEDLPCQLSTALRTQAVTKLGELIHSYHVDLIVVSNGPARRATMMALGDLIDQSPDGSIRWTLADRNGADVYAGSSIADEEMRTTPRRFRAAAWLAFSVLQPAQAFAKVDPLKLRLSSFQRELSDDQLSSTLDNVIVSGASRGGVDVNAAPVSWLTRIPGVTASVAEAIDQARREKLFESREGLSQLEQWASASSSRQALPFLRVFGSDKTLDGTLIHPDDYGLAEKLASALEIEMPPSTPPGYVAPDFSTEEDPTTKNNISEAPSQPAVAEVKDFSSAAEETADFSVDDPAESDAAAVSEGDASNLAAETTEDSSAESDSGEPVSAEGTPEAQNAAGETDAASQEVVEGDAAPETEASEADSDSIAADAEADSESPASQEIDKDSIPQPVRRPRPEAAKVDKCVKEWQVGSRRSHQLVQWLCDPFGDSDSSGNSPAVLSGIPSTKGLKPGDKVIGVVVGVMPFGVFVELAPDCSGLVHVSRISDSYVEDLHEAVQVGDVITAWVTGIDEKRRRVALSAVSPEREAELEAARQDSRGSRGSAGGNQRRGGRGGQGNRGGQSGGRGAQGSGTQGSGARGSDAQGARAQGSGGQTSRGGSGRDGGSGQGRGDARGGGRSGGRGNGQRRDGAGRGRGGRSGGGNRGRDRKPESYGVVSKAEAKPISDAMQKGEEPLRSFGDLMQFFGNNNSPKSAEPVKEDSKPKADTPSDAPKTSEVQGEAKPVAEDVSTPSDVAAPEQSESNKEES